MDKRKIIIDTDCGSDDAMAIAMALNDERYEILFFTTVSGNVHAHQAATNTLTTIERAGSYEPPVYIGCTEMLLKKLEFAYETHGQDGMGDIGLVPTRLKVAPGNGVLKILEALEAHEPNTIDIITLGNRQIQARAYVARFNFSGADQEKKCGMLSGGERNRLHLALALKEEGNVLLLDEPTNDIDVNTLRALEEGLENFAGCAVVISHDRWFLDRIATHILSFEGDSKVVFYEGSYSEYEEWKRAQGEDVTPHRVKYRKLME